MVLTASPSKRKSKPLSTHQIRKQKYKKISSVMATIAGAVTTVVHSPLLHSQREVVAETEVCLDGPQNDLGEGADVLQIQKQTYIYSN